MNINMKYYIVTICAIFIALGVGILVGFNLNYDQALTKQQSEVLESFNTEFDDLKSKNKNLQSEIDVLNGDLEKLTKYIDENLDVLTADTLTDKNTGIILSNENNDYSDQVEELIKKANGTVSFNIVLKDNINDQTKLQELSKDLNKTFKSSQDVINYIVSSLKDEKGYDQLKELESLDVIKINNFDEENYKEYDSVVLLDNKNENDTKVNFDAKEKIIIEQLKNEKKYLVAVAQSESDNTNLKLYSKNNISTIDNIDEGMGKISLTTLLKDQNIVGNYGNSELAKEPLAYKNK